MDEIETKDKQLNPITLFVKQIFGPKVPKIYCKILVKNTNPYNMSIYKWRFYINETFEHQRHRITKKKKNIEKSKHLTAIQTCRYFGSYSSNKHTA